MVVDSFELTRARDGARCALRPRDGDALIIDCAIAFDHAAIGAQRRRFVLDDGARFASEIAPARTFGLLADAEALRARGLARGASHDNTLVFDDEGPMSAPRFADEPVRHKILDVIGDCALLGAPLCGEVEVVRGGHALLCEVLRAALARGAVTSLSSHPG